ncbi:Serine/threonine protein kinase [Minicystis rosea]|nr:Serine/threonine protein kinase [Minicystis rosea]
MSAAVNAVLADRLLGTLIDARYRVERAIGAGGFGTVYRAFHVGLGSPVALKVLKLPEGLGAERLADLVGGFLEEGRTLKRLHHPNIVAALDVGLLPPDEAARELPYLVMEWCSGPTLKQALDVRGGRPMALEDAWRLFEPLLDAMAHAHAAGVAHRDLKPGNVILEPDRGGELKPRVIDFGIAKIVAPHETAGSGATQTVSGASPFTPRYAAPEQLAGARTGPWTDVHALALVFVELVTGRPAIGTDADAMLTVVDPVRPTPEARGVDVGALEPVLRRALALRPADRYPDASALAHAMRAAYEGSGLVTASPASTTTPDVQPSETSTITGVDPTAPPASHTLRTTNATSGIAPAPRRPWVRRVVAALGAATLVLGAAVGVQHHLGGWPFSKRLRDVEIAEIDRRAKALGLGHCATGGTAEAYTVTCDEGAVALMHLGAPYSTPAAVRAHVDTLAASYKALYGAARFAIDAGAFVLVATRPERLSQAFQTVLDHAVVDVQADANPEPPATPPKRSAQAASALAAWTGADMVASVIETGLHVAYSNAAMEPAVVTLYQDGKSATVCLYTSPPDDAFFALKTQGALAYARDGNKALTVSGDPTYANTATVRRILAGARAAEVEVYRR